MSSKELPLMRKATAVWLVDNTSLTFKQIADFCGMHELEVQGIADGDVSYSIVGQNPIANGQLTKEEIEKCEADKNASLTLKDTIARHIQVSTKKTTKYTPVARRGDKPDGIAFLLKYYPEITDAQIRKIIGTTKAMIEAIRTKTHWNYKNIKPRDPVLLGLCSQSQFNKVIDEINSENLKELKESKVSEEPKKPEASKVTKTSKGTKTSKKSKPKDSKKSKKAKTKKGKKEK